MVWEGWGRKGTRRGAGGGLPTQRSRCRVRQLVLDHLPCPVPVEEHCAAHQHQHARHRRRQPAGARVKDLLEEPLEILALVVRPCVDHVAQHVQPLLQPLRRRGLRLLGGLAHPLYKGPATLLPVRATARSPAAPARSRCGAVLAAGLATSTDAAAITHATASAGATAARCAVAPMLCTARTVSPPVGQESRPAAGCTWWPMARQVYGSYTEQGMLSR